MLRVDPETLLAMLEHAPGFICLTDVHARIRYLNRTAHGYTMEETIGKSWYDFLSPEQAEVISVGFTRALATGQQQDTEHFLDTPGSGRRWFLTRISVLRDAAGCVTGLVTIITDVTDKREIEKQLESLEREKAAQAVREKLEAQLRHEQKLQSLGTLASGVAHEINNPIQGILGFAQLIMSRAPETAEIHRFAKEITVECKHVARIVNNLLTFARQEKEQRTPAMIREIVDATVSLIRATLEADHILVEVDVPQDLSEVSCRSHEIQQVVMNLVTNARDALNSRYPGQHVDKRLRIQARGFDRAGAQWVRVTVEDRGIGVDPAVADRIFDPFFTTKRDSGTGLGLSVSHGIVNEHRGQLRFESETGCWTRFHVELPVDAVTLKAS